MKIGIAGVHYGHIGGMFRSAISAPNGTVIGIYEPNDDLFHKYADEHNLNRFDDLEALVASSDVVAEGMRHEEKADLVELCATHQTHAFLDKPLCRNESDFKRIDEAVKKSEIRLTMNFTSRNHPPFVALRDAIQKGKLGEIVSLITTHPHKLGSSAPDWYFDPERYAGTFHDLAGHGVDQILWLTQSRATAVHALGTAKRWTTKPLLEFDHVQASIQLSTGALATATADWLTPQNSPSFGDTRFILMGTKGSAHLRAYAEDGLLICSEKKGRYSPELPDASKAGFVERMISAYEANEENSVSTQDVLSASKTCLAAERSSKNGGELIRLSED
jgi:predicted dehydrogenase